MSKMPFKRGDIVKWQGRIGLVTETRPRDPEMDAYGEDECPTHYVYVEWLTGDDPGVFWNTTLVRANAKVGEIDPPTED